MTDSREGMALEHAFRAGLPRSLLGATKRPEQSRAAHRFLSQLLHRLLPPHEAEAFVSRGLPRSRYATLSPQLGCGTPPDAGHCASPAVSDGGFDLLPWA